MKKIRIFISSPSDVKQERMIAKKVINELANDYYEYVEIESLLWEDMPLEATQSFQEGIDIITNKEVVDIAIFILWTKLGTTLGKRFLKSDGTPYRSGTEYEFDMMYTSYQKIGKPRILAYFKNAPFSAAIADLKSEADISAAVQQQMAVKSFIADHFKDEETQTNYARMRFDRPETFENQLKVHLKTMIKDYIGENVEIPKWKGNPYVGLCSFNYDQRTIFCGRKRTVNDIVRKFIQVTDKDEKPTLFLLGSSGSGKSSLVKAGILPYVKEGLITDNENAKDYSITPSQYGNGLYEGLLGILKDSYPNIVNNPVWEDLEKGVKDDYNFNHLSFALRETNKISTPILFIDQFEELFTDTNISEEERIRVLLLLRGMVQCKQIWMFFSMRNDFYDRFSIYEDLNKIRNIAFVLDIPTLASTEIAEIVEEPAQKAGLLWEINDSGIGLNKIIANDAVNIKELPLIEFALQELYKHKTTNNYLTFEAYQEIGGLQGAFIQYVENLYSSFSDEEKILFSEILAGVVSPSNVDNKIFVRKTSLVNELNRSEAHDELLRKLVNGHILITDKDSKGEATITLVHEILITSWPVIKKWIEQEKYFINQNNYYASRAQHWMDEAKPEKELIKDEDSLLEAEYFVFSWEKYADNRVLNFLLSSLRKKRRKGLVSYSLSAIFTIFILFCLIISIINKDNLDSSILEFYSKDVIITTSIYSILSLGLLAHGILLRVLGKPKYKTIKFSLIVWSIVSLYVLIDTIKNLVTADSLLSEEGIWLVITEFIVLLPVLFVLSKNFRLFKERKEWEKRIFKVGKRSTKFYDFFIPLFAFLVIMIMVLGGAAVWSTSLNEKQEKLERCFYNLDVLFDGLENQFMNGQISNVDFYIVNDYRTSYLKDNFAEDILSEDYNIRKLQYAKCKYFSNEIDSALIYLDYRYWDNHLVMIRCYQSLGQVDNLKLLLSEYAKSDTLFIKTNIYSPINLLWDCEKTGLIDEASSLYEKMDKQSYQWKDIPAYHVNRAHLEALAGNEQKAYAIYDSIRNLPGYADYIVKEVSNDLSVFRWYGKVDISPIQSTMEKLKISIPQVPSLGLADSISTKKIIEDLGLEGTWSYVDSLNNIQANMSIDSGTQLCKYEAEGRNSDGIFNPLFKGNTILRLKQTEDNSILWEEFSLVQDHFSYGTIDYIDKEILKLKIIDNGIPEEAGTIRIYYKK